VIQDSVHPSLHAISWPHPAAATHTAQKRFMETAADAKDFIIMVKQKLEGMSPDDILNMDQTPIPFSFHSNKTLEVKGTKTIHARTSTTDTK
jgi:hypothetical protein